MSDIANFSVFSRNPDGILEDNPPNSPEYTYVASAINIALSILESPKGNFHLVELALEFDSCPEGPKRFHGSRDVARSWVSVFLNKIRAQFPAVIIDHTMTNPDWLGSHPRGEWDGSLDRFNSRSQMICISGPRVNDMIASTGSQSDQIFRNFQFLFATTLVHETGGHLLLTFIGNGRLITPDSMHIPGYGDPGVGESGRYLEMHLFGGTTEFFQGKSQDMRQTGSPHQVDDQGRAWRIHPNSINAVVRYEFSFPFSRMGNSIDQWSMKTMGVNSFDPPVDMVHRAMLARQTTFLGQVLGRPGHRVRLEDTKAVPMNPAKMLQAC